MQTLKQIVADFYNWHALPTRLKYGRVKEAVTAPSADSAYDCHPSTTITVPDRPATVVRNVNVYDRFFDNIAVAYTYHTNRHLVVKRVETRRTLKQAVAHHPWPAQ